MSSKPGGRGLRGDARCFDFALLCLLVQLCFLFDLSLPHKEFVVTDFSGHTDFLQLDRLDAWRWKDAEIPPDEIGHFRYSKNPRIRT